jgi:uncharacterized DUF497 family protein
MLKFEWDTAKATSNKKKHGVSFEEAQSVFYDEFAVQFFDEDNSVSEERFVLIGLSHPMKMNGIYSDRKWVADPVLVATRWQLCRFFRKFCQQVGLST